MSLLRILRLLLPLAAAAWPAVQAMLQYAVRALTVGLTLPLRDGLPCAKLSCGCCARRRVWSRPGEGMLPRQTRDRTTVP